MLLNMKLAVLLTFGMLFFKGTSSQCPGGCGPSPLPALMRNLELLSDELDSLPIGNRRLFISDVIEKLEKLIQETVALFFGLSVPSGNGRSSGRGSSQGGGRNRQAQRRLNDCSGSDDYECDHTVTLPPDVA
ncbi:uncharacterized protein LOC128198228 [Bicyclus anynana]|uniref:Uncharacterized protein LOC128198228 n=1 Tax=Bicyclus anynana TaxID=110368 RepID=A0ABM3LH89_BICAN|nr:uncharacterized protein LOC128198228 [Bicyclus anynana]